MPRNKKPIYLIFVLAFFLFLSGFSILSVLEEDQSRSTQENRSLKKFPAIHAEELWNGSWFQAFESYNKDQFPGRAYCMQGYYRLLDLLKVNERSGYVRGKQDAILSTRNSQVTEKRLASAEKYGEAQVDTMKVLASAADEWGGKVIYLNIPHKIEFFADLYPDYYNSDQEIDAINRSSIIEKARAASISVVETYDTMQAHKDEYLYFYTDNHYTIRGAYYSYLELLKCINELDPTLELQFPKLEDLEHTVNHNRFAGSYLKTWGDSNILSADYVEYLYPRDMPEYTRYDNGELSDIPLYDTTKASYSNIMGGDKGIDTNRDHLPSILFIGFSYSNAIEPLAVYNFNRMESIDPRHWSGSICAYMRQSQPDYIVVVRDDIYAENSYFTCTVE